MQYHGWCNCAAWDYILLDIDEQDLYERGRVAWIRKTPSSLRAGILKTEPFKGRFALYPLPDILIGLQRTLKTGILNVKYGTINKKIFIRNGNVISAASNYEKDRLGDALLKGRRINKKQYNKAAEIKRKSGASYTAILLHIRYLKPPDVIRAAGTRNSVRLPACSRRRYTMTVQCLSIIIITAMPSEYKDFDYYSILGWTGAVLSMR